MFLGWQFRERSEREQFLDPEFLLSLYPSSPEKIRPYNWVQFVTIIHSLSDENWLDWSVDSSSVAAITTAARGPFGARGSWHSAKVPPPKDGLKCYIPWLVRDVPWPVPSARPSHACNAWLPEAPSLLSRSVPVEPRTETRSLSITHPANCYM